MRKQRRIGGRNHDDRSEFRSVRVACWRCWRIALTALALTGGNGLVVRNARLQIGDLLANRNTRDPKISSRPEVTLHQNAHRVPTLLRWQLTRRRTDSALEPLADHA